MSKPNKPNTSCRCKTCGFRRRSKNHDEGTHHAKGRPPRQQAQAR